MLIDSVFITGKTYYPQVLLEECKHIIKEKRFLSILLMIQKFLLKNKILMNRILMKKILMKKILMKKILKILIELTF